MRVILAGALILTACGGSPTTSVTPGGPAPDGLELLVADLEAAGADVGDAGTFDPAPISRRSRMLCVNGHKVSVYIYASELDRQATASDIDPRDPSHVGRTIIEWAGDRRFWQRDRIIVLYLGEDPATEMLLSSLLGPPFARGLGRSGRGETC